MPLCDLAVVFADLVSDMRDKFSFYSDLRVGASLLVAVDSDSKPHLLPALASCATLNPSLP